MARLSLICIGLVLLATVWSSSLNIEGSSKHVLVLLDNLAIRESHSFYFKQLKGETKKISTDLVEWVKRKNKKFDSTC
jgi:hypothetical protein